MKIGYLFWISQYQLTYGLYVQNHAFFISSITLLMRCTLAMVEVRCKDKGKDDNNEQKHNQNDVQIHRRYSGGHHCF